MVQPRRRDANVTVKQIQMQPLVKSILLGLALLALNLTSVSARIDSAGNMTSRTIPSGQLALTEETH